MEMSLKLEENLRTNLFVLTSVDMRFPERFTGYLLVAQRAKQLTGIVVPERRHGGAFVPSLGRTGAVTWLAASRSSFVSLASSAGGAPLSHRPVWTSSESNRFLRLFIVTCVCFAVEPIGNKQRKGA